MECGSKIKYLDRRVGEEQAALDRQGMTGDPGGVSGGEERDRAGHVFRLADSAQGV